MNQIEQTFIDNIEIAIDQLNKGIIDNFNTSIIPLNFICEYLEKKYKYELYRSYVDPDFDFNFIFKNKNQKLYISGNFIHGSITLKYKNET